MANIKIPFEKIKKIEVIYLEKGITGNEVLNKYKPDYIINLGLYDMSTKNPLSKIKDENKSYGYLFSDKGFGIEADKILWTDKNTDMKDFIGGSPALLSNGKLSIDWGNKYSEYIDQTHYRSAVGIDNNNIYLLCTDNKLSINSLATTCINLGMKYAINLDGGGSCCLYDRNKFLKSSTRANSNWLLVFLKGGEEMEIQSKYISYCKRRKGKVLKPTTLTIHSTGNPKSTAYNEWKYLNSIDNENSASWHICVDEKECIQAIPFNEVAFHSGNTTGNNTSIGLEICESGNREKTLRNAIEITAKVLQMYNWDISNLRQHYDWNKKNCPRILRDTGKWKWFKSEVKKEMEKVNITRNKIEFDGKTIDSLIINSEGVTYAPVRELAEMLGLKVGFDNSTKRVKITK